ncbi:hypothetical protein [Paeniglutamicibacter sp.]|uniref:hypothetical protein n=1 Tax=Paeniglutamicibacter sp. TaxID=1934391 RepID=UPI00398975B3
MPPTENGPGVSARAVIQENSVVGSSLPHSRIPDAPIIRTAPNKSFPGALLIIVKCPFCGHEHTHGNGGSGDGTGHRVAHCAPPAGTWHRRQRLEQQEAEYQGVVDRIIDNYSHDEISSEQLEKSIKAPLAHLRETTAKLQAINERYPRGKGYYVTDAPIGQESAATP